MKKQERKENGNKGFSLVELIVVVAIMAVLLVVLTPQYLRYVERTRLQRDNSALAEIANSIKIALADEDINAATPNGTTITSSNVANTAKEFDFAGTTTGDGAAVCAELVLSIGDDYATSSTTYRDSSAAIVFEITNSGGTISVRASDGWIDNVGDDGAGGTHNFN